MALQKVDSSEWAVRMMTGISNLSRICFAASIPFILPERPMSMRTRDGRSSPAFLMASSPLSTMAGTS